MGHTLATPRPGVQLLVVRRLASRVGPTVGRGPTADVTSATAIEASLPGRGSTVPPRIPGNHRSGTGDLDRGCPMRLPERGFTPRQSGRARRTMRSRPWSIFLVAGAVVAGSIAAD